MANPELRGYKLCPECGQPMLKEGQKRKHPDSYRHASGCSHSLGLVYGAEHNPRPWMVDINGVLLRTRARVRTFATAAAAIKAGRKYLAKKYPPIDIKALQKRAREAL